jgi:tetratricopeptide (TPR) repeat protein
MPFENYDKEVIKALKTKDAAVFCGAGISYNSGLPIVSALLDYLFSKLELTTKEAEEIYNSDLPFESIMEMVLNESGLEEIQNIFTAGNQNANHILLAKLAKRGFLKIIYTTNFDVLIEKALESEGLSSGSDFKVYSSESDFDSICWDDDSIKVIKIHGCATKKEDMALTMSLIASDKYSAMRKSLLHEIFGGGRCSNVIVLGYSCSDLDLTPLIESFTGKKSNIFFIEHQSSPRLPASESVSAKAGRNPFRNYEGLRLFVDTNKLVKDIWEVLLDEEYFNDPAPNIAWKENIDQWYFKSVEESGTGVKHHIAARLLYAVAEFEEAIEHNRKAVAIALKSNNMLAYSAEIGNMGMALSAIGDNEQAKFCLEESIPLCKRMRNLQGLSAQLQTYGNILHRTGDNRNAIEAHKDALYYAEVQNDENAISTVLGDMSNAYNKLGMYNDAVKSLNRALDLSRKLGNRQAESSQLGIMAGTYLGMGEFQQCLEYCLKGAEMKKTLGDRQGESMLLVNLLNIYRILDKKQEALKVADECLALAKKIGNKQAEQMVMLNISLM